LSVHWNTEKGGILEAENVFIKIYHTKRLILLIVRAQVGEVTKLVAPKLRPCLFVPLLLSFCKSVFFRELLLEKLVDG
jgi:hypothetical protein